jgi:drug/metabolite transporter (DMT)-like permease
VVSAVLGASSHLLWDGVTHSDGMIASRVALLRAPIELPILDTTMVLHRVLQHASTVVGLLVVVAVVGRVLHRTTPIELPPRPRVWPRLIALACVAAGFGLAVLRLWGRRTDDIGNVVVVLISGVLFGVLLTSIVLHRAASRAAPQTRLAAVSKS